MIRRSCNNGIRVSYNFSVQCAISSTALAPLRYLSFADRHLAMHDVSSATSSAVSSAAISFFFFSYLNNET